MSDDLEDNTTKLISLLFDWLEVNQPEYLSFDDVDLRGAFERYFYFRAIAKPQSLSPLLAATKDWRSDSLQHELAGVYDYYHQLVEQSYWFNRRKANLLPWLNLVADIAKSRRSYFDLMTLEKSEKTGSIGFFVINSRYVKYFENLSFLFSKEKCIYFSPHPSKLSVSVKAQDGILARSYAKYSWQFDTRINRGHPLFPVYYRLCYFYWTIKSQLSAYRPKVLLFAEATSHYDDLAARVATKIGIPTIRLQSGRAGVLHNGYRNMYFDAMVCWSQDFVDRYREVSPRPAYYVSGSPLLDDYYREHQIQKALPEQHVVIFTQPVNPHIPLETYNQLVKVAEQLLQASDGITIIVRKHPVDALTEFDRLAARFPDRVKFMASGEYSLGKTLSCANCAIGFYSTTLSEAAACGVIPVILKLQDLESVFPHPELHGAAITVDSIDRAIEVITRVLNHPSEFESIRENMRNFSLRFFGPLDGKSKERLLDVIKHYAGGKTNVL